MNDEVLCTTPEIDADHAHFHAEEDEGRPHVTVWGRNTRGAACRTKEGKAINKAGSPIVTESVLVVDRPNAFVTVMGNV